MATLWLSHSEKSNWIVGVQQAKHGRQDMERGALLPKTIFIRYECRPKSRYLNQDKPFHTIAFYPLPTSSSIKLSHLT